jgi:predicted N-acetyltransferase YhbS
VPLREVTIGARDTAWFAPFERYIERVFPGVTFARWAELGCWDERYTGYALADGTEVVANVSVSRMDVLLQGRTLQALQLGSVGVTPEWRGRGLARACMQRVLAGLPETQLVYLFANPSVLAFYPRFGFRRVPQHVFGAERFIQPARQTLPRLSIDRASDRSLLHELSARARPVTSHFGARDYGTTLLWYWDNFYRDSLFYAARDRAIVITEHDEDALRICDVVASQPLALAPLLPHVAVRVARRLEFGFEPEQLWPEAAALRIDDTSPLFVRGPFPDLLEPLRYPMLAQT